MQTNEQQEKEISDLQGKIVGWKVFIWAISVIVILFGISFTLIASVSAKVDNVQAQYTEIKTQLSQIQTDLTWIKKDLNTKY